MRGLSPKEIRKIHMVKKMVGGQLVSVRLRKTELMTRMAKFCSQTLMGGF